MTIYQMLAHCARCEEMMLGRKLYKREFMGRIFGKIAIKGFLKDDSPLKHGMPTVPAFRVKENTGDTAAEKAKLIALVEAYAHFSNPYSIHPFFGKMTAAQIGLMEYKHLDHHLRQFNS